MTTHIRTPLLDMGDSLVSLTGRGSEWEIKDIIADLAYTSDYTNRPLLSYYSAEATGSVDYAHRSQVAGILQEDPESLRISLYSVRARATWCTEQAAAKAAAESLIGGRFITLEEAEAITGMTPKEYAHRHYSLVRKWEEFLPEYYWRTPKGSVRKMRGGEIDDELEEHPGEILILESDARRFAFEKPGVDRRLEKEWEESSDNC